MAPNEENNQEQIQEESIQAEEIQEQPTYQIPKEITEQERESLINEVCSRKYELKTFKGEEKRSKVSIYHDLSLFSKETIDGLLTISRKIKKEIVLISWPNSNAPQILQDYLNKKRGVYFFILPEPALFPAFMGPYNDDYIADIYYRYNDKPNRTLVCNYQINYWSDYRDKLEIFDEGNRFSIDGDTTLMKVFAKATIVSTSILFNPTDQSLVNVVLKSYYNNYAPILQISHTISAREKMAESYTKNYGNMCLNGLKKTVRSLTDKLADSTERIRQSYVSIANSERQIADTNLLIKGAENNLSNFDQYFQKESENLKRVFVNLLENKYKEFLFNMDGNVIGYTKMIYATVVIPKDSGGDGVTVRKYRIGEFEVTINVKDNYVTLINRTKRMNYGNSYFDHPHIVDGKPCLGNIKEAVPKLIAQADYMAVFLLMYDYLVSINWSGQYSQALVSRWPEVKPIESRIPVTNTQVVHCSSCELDLDECECERCGDCNNLLTECSCFQHEPTEREIAELDTASQAENNRLAQASEIQIPVNMEVVQQPQTEEAISTDNERQNTDVAPF